MALADPRKDIKKFNGTISYDEVDSRKIVSINFESQAELLDARYELIDCNNPILVKDSDESKVTIIEPSRIQATDNHVELSADIEEE